MGGTVLSQVVGYYMGNKNDFRSGGVNLTSSWRYWASFVLDLGSGWSSNRPWEKVFLDSWWGVRCRAFLESWVLVYIWFSSHYHMYRNGILTFGPSSWGTGDLGTRNLVTLAQMACFTHFLGPFGQSDQISGSRSPVPHEEGPNVSIPF